MNTLIIAENRKLGVDWLGLNMPPNDATDKRRTQTSITFKNGDNAYVISKVEHFVPQSMTNNDKAVIVGAIDQGLINMITENYRGKGFALEIEHHGQILTQTELKRRQCLQQLEDLEKEERLNLFFNQIQLDGIRFTKTEVNTNGNSRSFSVVVQGKFT